MTFTPFCNSITWMDVDTFRILRPALNNPDRYPNALIQHYLALSQIQFDLCRWANLIDEGVLDWTSHYVVIQVRNAQAAERGAVSGNDVGRVTAKSVGGVSVSYAVGDTSENDGGHWNTTTYGSAFLRNAKMVGTGGVQITGVEFLNLGPGFGPAWPGPPEWNYLPVSSI